MWLTFIILSYTFAMKLVPIPSPNLTATQHWNGQVQVGIAHEGFRTIIYNYIPQQKYICEILRARVLLAIGRFFSICCYSGNRNTSVNYRGSWDTAWWQPDSQTDRQTDGQRSLINRAPFLPFGYGTLKTACDRLSDANWWLKRYVYQSWYGRNTKNRSYSSLCP
jgi:hypothetical protein